MKHALILAGLLAVGSPMPVPAPAPLSVDFDRVIQARFGQVTDADIRKGRLGVSRVLEPATHQKLFAAHGAEERRSLDGLREQGWQVSFYVQPLTGLDALVGPIRTSQEAPGEDPERRELSGAARRAIEGRAPVLAFLGAARVEARPIPASSPTCLGCHSDVAKVGDPLGAAVYVFTPRRMP